MSYSTVMLQTLHPPNLKVFMWKYVHSLSTVFWVLGDFELWWRSRRCSEVHVGTFRTGWTLQIPLSSISDRPQIPKYAYKASGWLSGHLANPAMRWSHPKWNNSCLQAYLVFPDNHFVASLYTTSLSCSILFLKKLFLVYPWDTAMQCLKKLILHEIQIQLPVPTHCHRTYF